jgi:uncharacterized oxidoreductase
MQLTGNTIFITGGGTGLGRGLAEALHKLGNRVIIAGRRSKPLQEVTAAHPGMTSLTLDVADAASISQVAAELAKTTPELNVLINMAGIMELENLKAQTDTSVAERTIAINLLGTIRMTAALLPHLLARPRSAVLTVSSGLASVPLAWTPTYCATKAAIHSYTDSLRFQMRGTPVEVIEIAPPWVQTELMGPSQATEPRAMPLAPFIEETMQLLAQQPTPKEILVERVKPLRFAEKNGSYDAIFEQLASVNE